MHAKLKLVVMLKFLLLLVFIVNVGILLYFQNLSSLQILFWDKLLYLIVGHGKKILNGFFPSKSSKVHLEIFVCASSEFAV